MLKIHPHALHEIMGEPSKIDPALITPDVEVILTRKKRTDAEKALIQELKDHTLSEGAKSAVERWVVEQQYGFKDFTGNKYTEKGLTLEDHAIKAVQMNSLFTMGQFIGMQKNEKTLEDEFLIGTPDIINDDHGRDTKCSWSGVQHPFTFRRAEKKTKENGYDWQMRAYMRLTNKPKWAVDFVLLPTPENLIYSEDQREQQVVLVNQIPLNQRITTVWIERDFNLEKLMLVKCSLAQAYAQIVIAELNGNKGAAA
ncbi:hypothetical protein QZK48_08415 [Acinetobacter baumannii]|nr:hypothetical protein [Acinetobacter baumannii]